MGQANVATRESRTPDVRPSSLREMWESGRDREHQTVSVPISWVKDGLSPRFVREDRDHVQALAEAIDSLPPILVRREDMTLIDGLHRLQAAKLLGRTTIRVQFFAGTVDDAYLWAVQTNIAHGKPLSLAERRAAARRVIATHGQLSDRGIASICGLSPKAVGTLRPRSTGDGAQLDTRVGLDGKLRHTDIAALRRRVLELVLAWPDASLREIARAAQTSPAVVRDVRERLRRGEDPIAVGRRRGPTPPATNETAPMPPPRDKWAADLAILSAAAEFPAWFAQTGIVETDWQSFVGTLPISRVYDIVDEARARAAAWVAFADALLSRVAQPRGAARA